MKRARVCVPPASCEPGLNAGPSAAFVNKVSNMAQPHAPMRIALICDKYHPLRSSCAVQMTDLAKELLLQGHEPIVVVPAENIYEASTSEVIGGVQVYRLAAFKVRDAGYFRRTLNEIFLPFTMLHSLRKSDFPIAKLDAVVWYSPTIFFGFFVQALKRSSKCSAYLILRDIFPEWALDLGIINRGPVYYFFKFVARYQYSVADIIGVQTPSNLGYLLNWSKKSNRRLEVLANWLSVETRHESSISVSETCLHGRKIFVYIGNMGIAQGMDVLVDLANALQHRQDIGFLFVGRGTEVDRLKTKVVSGGLDNILFYDEIDSKEISGLLSMCHVGLVALDPRHKSHNIPGKFLSYIRAGLPVLARINTGTDLATLIEGGGVGRVYTGIVIDEFKGIAEELADNESDLKLMSERGISLSQSMFSTNAAVKQIVSALSCERLIRQ